ncbi:hypothetical protein NDN08_004763 [Rhodosorus marinus]|uniref:MICOS complex subunit MIC60 n=1 Tax=Rhodosorus marinus TaxID=101924 RepID=A0AAV8UQ97_9RHOD|nr:hypothetical protein NDN08_004763 [Rhodosorus marinus]
MSDASKNALPPVKRSRWPVALLSIPLPALLFYAVYNRDSGFRDRVEKAIPGFREYARYVSSGADEDLGGASSPSGSPGGSDSKPSDSIWSKIQSSFTFGNSRSGDSQHETGRKTATGSSNPSNSEEEGSRSHEGVTYTPTQGSETVEANQVERWSPKPEGNSRNSSDSSSDSSSDPDGSTSKPSAPDQKTEAPLALSTRLRDAWKGLLANFSSSTNGKDSKSSSIPPSPDVQSPVGDGAVISTADQEAETNALKMELESFEESITQLRYELQSRSKWEAVRLEELLRAAEMEERKKIASEALKAVEAVKKELERKAAESRAKLEAEIEEEIRARIAEGEAGLVSMTERQVEEGIQGHKRKLRAQWRDRVCSLRAEDQRIREEDHQKRMDLFKSLQERAEVLTEAAVHLGEYEEASAAGADSVFKSQEMFHIVEGGQAMQNASKNPELANGRFEEKGIPSLAELQNQYKRAAKESLAAAMIPEGRELTTLSWIVAKTLSKFKVRSHVPGDNGPNSVLGRAGDALDTGNLEVALSELERLDGLPKELLQDWISNAQGRLMVDSRLSLSLQEAEKANAQLL